MGDMSERHEVFVYGTLMQGEHHHHTLARAEFLGLVETLPLYDLVQIDYYPALLPGGTARVVGELYRVDDATLKRLDELEEVPAYYVRERIELADGRSAFAYLMPRARATGSVPIDSGYFRMRTAPPKRRA
jgi:gamma-glutamylcyclotransferase (GGCT)/AIG2-like uncharacterized protein YtfP